jgi:FAD/FMN-containing dehydrogenase
MQDAHLTRLDGSTVTICASAVEALGSALRGRVLDPTAEEYDKARAIWNAMIDRRPGLIVRCRGVADVMQAVRFARDHKALVAVRGGGHNIAGSALCEGGLVIDLSAMASVRIDPASRRAWVEPGVTLGEVDRETQAFGLAVPTGINSTTGIGGLTLGGGFGWITRKFGLTIDNLLSADVVTADAAFHHVDAETHADLFWALRGGGGNFGIVSGFEFQLHAVGPEVMSGLVVHPLDGADELLRQYRGLLAAAPDELTCWTVMRKAPPLPFLPAEWHGREVLVLAMCYVGQMKDAERHMAGLRALGRPIADVVGPHSFTGWQAAFDPLLTSGARNYWKSHDFAELSDTTIGLLVDAAWKLPGPESEIFIFHVGGAAGRVAPDATAFQQRGAHFGMNVHARWRDPAMDRVCMDWAKQVFEATAPQSLGTAYVNFMPDDEAARVEAIYGASYGRLAEIKLRYDPANMFRINQNIRPAAN